MKTFSGATAVITGAAGGIGLACAEEAVRRGMNVVVADVREAELEQAAEALRAAGGTVLAVPMDAGDAAAVEDLAAKAKEAFGTVNLLVNNAGIFASGVAWNVPVEQYEWVVKVNLLSVAYGIRAFVPDMIASGQECHVVNVASAAGLTSTAGFCTYSTTKHGVLAMTEALYFDLATHGITAVGATCVMPGYVQTDVMNPMKVAPPELAEALSHRLDDPVCDAIELQMRQGVEAGMPVTEAVDLIFGAVEEGQLYVLPNAEPTSQFALMLADCRVNGKNPPSLAG